MKRLIAILLTIVVLSTGCSDTSTTIDIDIPQQNLVVTDYTEKTECPIALADRENKEVLVLERECNDWSRDTAVIWSWKPDKQNGFTNLPSGWGRPNAPILRSNAVFGGAVVVITDMDGFCGIVEYPNSKNKRWVANLGVDVEPVSAELLENGDVVIVSKKQGFLRVYTSSQSVSAKDYTETVLDGACAALWDSGRKRLWALGNSMLNAYKIVEDGGKTILVQDTELSVKLPKKKPLTLTGFGDDTLMVEYGSERYIYNIGDKKFSNASEYKHPKGTFAVDSVYQPKGKTLCMLLADKNDDAKYKDMVFFSHQMAKPETRIRGGIYAADISVFSADYFNGTPKDILPIAVADQKRQRVAIYDACIEDWSNEDALLWQWRVSPSTGIKEDVWFNVTDIRFADSSVHGGKVMAACASNGFQGIISYPEGKALWYNLVTDKDNPHSIELLPNGNVIVAASIGGWLRVYNSSQGKDGQSYSEFPLMGAHGVVYDKESDILWALGSHELVSLKVGGTEIAPTITELGRYRVPGSNGHDLESVHGNADRLWVTSNEVMQFVKSEGLWDKNYKKADIINKTDVKAVSDRGNYIVMTKPNGVYRYYCTDVIQIFGKNGSYTTRRHDTAAYYKARLVELD